MKALDATLADNGDIMLMNNCVSFDLSFTANLKYYKNMVDFYIDSFEISTNDFNDVKLKIVDKVMAFYKTKGGTLLKPPVYVMVLQAPNYT